MQLSFIDIPYVYNYNELGFKIIEALDDSTDINLFGLKSVQIMIDSLHHHWSRVNLVFIGIPLVIQLTFFLFYSNFVLPLLAHNAYEEKFNDRRDAFRVILLISTVYLLLVELSYISR